MVLSVWGKADDLKLSWEGTGHGFSNIANAKNDNLMVLDEIGQASPRVVAHTAYSVINGTGKVQGRKEGGNRHINRWRVLVLSTGEKTLEGFLKAGKSEWHAGQANRLPSTPANAGKGYGVFDTLHDQPNGATLSEEISHASNELYGTVGKAFITRMLADLDNAKQQVNDAIHVFIAGLPALSGQSRHVAYRFALAAAALELASHYEITGLAAGTASMGIRQCFDDWLKREGTGRYEDRRIIEQTTAFFEQFGATERFLHWNDTFAPRDYAGYKEAHFGDFDSVTHIDYWVISPVFQSEICGSFDLAKVRDVLTKNDILQRGKHKAMRQRKINKVGKWFYVLRIQSAEADDG